MIRDLAKLCLVVAVAIASTITTASAPGGIGAPLAVSVHSPGTIPPAGA